MFSLRKKTVVLSVAALCAAVSMFVGEGARAQTVTITERASVDDLAFEGASLANSGAEFPISGNQAFVIVTPYRWDRVQSDGTEGANDGVDNHDWWWAFEATGVAGVTPFFDIDNRGLDSILSTPNSWGGIYSSGYRPVWSVDQVNWQPFDHVTSGSTYFNSDPFTADTVYVSYAVPYTPSMAESYVSGLMSHPLVSPTVSGDANGVVGMTANSYGTDFRGMPVPDYDLVAFQVADASEPGVDGPKQQIVLMGGNHASESSGVHTIQGMVDFLLSDHPLAGKALTDGEFYVYPMVDPEGRARGHTRGNDAALAPSQRAAVYADSKVVDHNRVWPDSSPVYPEVATIRNAIIADTDRDASNPNDTDIDWFFDFHGFPTGDGTNGDKLNYNLKQVADHYNNVDGSPSLWVDPSPNDIFIYDAVDGWDRSGYIEEMYAALGREGIDFYLSREPYLAGYGSADIWAHNPLNGINADHSFTPEISVPDADFAATFAGGQEGFYQTVGEAHLRALVVSMFPDTVFFREDSVVSSWDGADWAQANETAPVLDATTAVFIAKESGVFSGPTANTTVRGLELRGIGTSGGFVFEQSADYQLSSIGGDLIIEDAEYRIVGDRVGDVVHQYGLDPQNQSTMVYVGENGVLNLGRDAGGQRLITSDMTMDPSARLVMNVGGSTPGEFDFISVGSLGFLHGTLELAKPDNDTLALYQNFAPIIVDRIYASPDQIEGVVLDSNFGLAVNYAINPGVDVSMALLGDANRDGSVDNADFLVWQQNFGADTSAWTRGDFNGDGAVDGVDLGIWQDHFGMSAGPDTVFWRDADVYASDWDNAEWAQTGTAAPVVSTLSDVVIASSKTVTFEGSTGSPIVRSLDVRSIGSGDLTFEHQPGVNLSATEGITITQATYRYDDSQTGGYIYAQQSTLTLGPDATLDLGDGDVTQLAVAQDYVQDDSATLRLMFGSDGQSLRSDSVLIFGGNAQLDGTLDLVMQSSYNPTVGDLFNLVWGANGATIDGLFSLINGVSLDLVSELGLAVLYGQVATDNVTGLVTYLGDTNGDLMVDGFDLSVLASNFNQPGLFSWADGDFNGDGTVGQSDLDLLTFNFGKGSGGVIPEPASLAMLLIGGGVLMRRRRA